MSSHDLRDMLDGIHTVGRMDTVYPEPMSRLHKGVSVKLFLSPETGLNRNYLEPTITSNFSWVFLSIEK